METKENKSGLLLTGTLAALGASLCCITPVLGVVAGIGGAASAFSWLEPFRPYLVALTLMVLAFAWYRRLKPAKQTLACACEAEPNKASFFQSKTFLGVATVAVLLLLAFPYYSSAIIPSVPKTKVTQSAELQLARLDIKGMTCSGCEGSVTHALASKKGVVVAKASYESGSAEVTFQPSIVSVETLKKAIEAEVGYSVTGTKLLTKK